MLSDERLAEIKTRAEAYWSDPELRAILHSDEEALLWRDYPLVLAEVEWLKRELDAAKKWVPPLVVTASPNMTASIVYVDGRSTPL